MDQNLHSKSLQSANYWIEELKLAMEKYIKFYGFQGILRILPLPQLYKIFILYNHMLNSRICQV